MPTQDRPQATTTLSKQPERHAHVPGRLRDLVGARLDTEIYLSTEEAAQYVSRPSRKAFIAWARRSHIPLRKPEGGRTILVKKGDLDFALRAR